METLSHIKDKVVATVSTDEKSKHLEPFRAEAGDYITTNFGTRIQHDVDTLKAGERGPSLLEDFHFREKMTHFDHERIPERVVHARGAAAHGFFEVYESQEEFTKAKFLCNPSKKTPVFVRFSTVAGSRGSADTVRDVRGFAVKFYTEEGNFSLVGNNIPVFFIQDAIKFPDVIHAAKPAPHNEIPQAQTSHDNFWDFISLNPESIHMSMWVLSDRAIPRSFSMMQGFGVHTFALVNARGQRSFVKFHWRPKLGVHSLAWDEANKLGGQDPDFHRRDLWEAIENGNYPEYEFGLQIVPEEKEHDFDFDLLDPTKIIPEELVPVRWVGRMVLNRNPDNFFAETEQVAFHPAHLVPGIDVTNDPLLQGRLFSYTDTQLSRLGGPNFEEIPINRPICPVFNNQRDGLHRTTINKGRVNYFPNRFGVPDVAPEREGGYVHFAEKVAGLKIRARGPKFQDHYSQATLFYNSLSKAEKEHLIFAAKFELSQVVDQGVRERMIAHFNHVDHELAKAVAKGIGVTPPSAPACPNHGRKSQALSQDNSAKDSIEGRKIAFLVEDGFDAVQLSEISLALKSNGAMPHIIGPHRGAVRSDTGQEVDADFTAFNSKSTKFDAVCIVGGRASVESLLRNGEVLGFVNEAFKHFKPICAVGEGVEFLKKCTLTGVQLSESDDVLSSQGVVTVRDFKAVSGAVSIATSFIEAIKQHRFWYRDISLVPAAQCRSELQQCIERERERERENKNKGSSRAMTLCT
ncbi:uncharacterized protein VTP21DRAFT_543 [Calcarisporiella thermophila]|uniref:uncharacterized protein n=1 Tax=Calcarisporiella thermophila TaxID=911321 RepID=UPI003742C64D